jgi:hypothetical protein
MITTIDTAVPQQNHFPFTSTQALVMPKPVEIGQVAAQDAAGGRSVQLIVTQKHVGPVFIQDTEGSVSVRQP